MNSNLDILYSSDSPNIGTTDISHDNEEKLYRNETVIFRVEFKEAFPKWSSIAWKMNNEVISGPRFLIVTSNMVS